MSSALAARGDALEVPRPDFGAPPCLYGISGLSICRKYEYEKFLRTQCSSLLDIEI